MSVIRSPLRSPIYSPVYDPLVGKWVGIVEEPETDPYFANVVLLVGFDGEDGATSATDESNSAHVLTFNGHAQIDTAVSKFGGGSLLCDGTGDIVSAPDSDDWYWPDEFTIEAFCRPNLTGVASAGIANQWSNVVGTCVWRFGYFYLSATQKRFQFQLAPDGNPSNGITLVQAYENIDQSELHHVAVDRDSDDLMRLYVNGVMKDSATAAGAVNASYLMRIGSYVGTSSGWNGWIDEVRITKGIARYASDDGFVVPTKAYPRS